MSIFRSYSPKSLYMRTLKLLSVIFSNPPLIETNPSSYFNATVNAHGLILEDLSGVLDINASNDHSQIAISEVHDSLKTIENTLFGTKSDFSVDIEGCCLYTDSIITRLKTNRLCLMQ